MISRQTTLMVARVVDRPNLNWKPGRARKTRFLSSAKTMITRFQRRLRFRLRTLFVLGTLAVIGVWLSVKWQDVRIQREGAKWVQEQKGHLIYEFGLLRPDGSYASDEQSGWLRDWLGIDFFSNVHGVILDNQEITDLKPLTKLKELRSLAIMTDILPGTSLDPIVELKHLEELRLDYTHIDSEELATISRRLPDCEVIVGEHALLD